MPAASPPSCGSRSATTAARATGYWFFFGVGFGAPVVATLGGEYLVAALGLDRGWRRRASASASCSSRSRSTASACGSAGAVQLVLSALLVVRRGGRGRDRGARRSSPRNFTPFLPHGWAGVGARDQPVRVGVRGVGGRHPHRARVPQSAPHHPARHRHRDRRRRRRLPRAAVRHRRRARCRAARAARCRSSTSSRSRCPASARSSSAASRRSSWSACSTPTSPPSPTSAPRSAATATCRAGSPRVPRPGAVPRRALVLVRRAVGWSTSAVFFVFRPRPRDRSS